MIEFIKYLIIGLVQGIAEVFPISSSGHLKIVESLMGISEENLALEVFLHMASLIAVIVFLYKPLVRLIKGTCLYVFKKREDYKFDAKYFLFLIISTIPVVIFTIILKLLDYKTSPLFIVGICLIINALILWILSRGNGIKKKEEMTIKDAVVIGLFQCIGVFPGISRSGSCISGASMSGLNKEDAADYAFMLFIPSVVGAFVLELANISLIFTLDERSIACYLAAFLVSAVGTYLAFKILLKVIKKGKLGYFSIYCILIGVLTIVYSAINGWI